MQISSTLMRTELPQVSEKASKSPNPVHIEEVPLNVFSTYFQTLCCLSPNTIHRVITLLLSGIQSSKQHPPFLLFLLPTNKFLSETYGVSSFDLVILLRLVYSQNPQSLSSAITVSLLSCLGRQLNNQLSG